MYLLAARTSPRDIATVRRTLEARAAPKGDDVRGDDVRGDDVTGDDGTGDDVTGDDVPSRLPG